MNCPSCGHDNIPGVDTCEECLGDLRMEDIPQASSVMEQKIMEHPVSSIAARRPPRVTATSTLRESIAAMREQGEGCLLVVDEGEALQGIFTERDVLKKIAGRESEIDLDGATVGEFMTARPETIRASDHIQVALHRMAVNDFRHLPIEDEGKAFGLITAQDVINFIEANFQDAVTRAFSAR